MVQIPADTPVERELNLIRDVARDLPRGVSDEGHSWFVGKQEVTPFFPISGLAVRSVPQSGPIEYRCTRELVVLETSQALQWSEIVLVFRWPFHVTYDENISRTLGWFQL
jgi:hypothetical protein